MLVLERVNRLREFSDHVRVARARIFFASITKYFACTAIGTASRSKSKPEFRSALILSAKKQSPYAKSECLTRKTQGPLRSKHRKESKHMKTLIRKIVNYFKTTKVNLASYREVWEIELLRAMEVRRMNEHESRRYKKPQEYKNCG